jgi:SNF2 family DNA or RNA helicase
VLRQLPGRTDQNILVPMTERQMSYHQENANIVMRIVQRWRRTGFLSDMDRRRMTCALQNMRLLCDNTYLVDKETDHGVKADELAALLDNLFADPDAKAVVFSQWTRTHDIVIRRSRPRGAVGCFLECPSSRLRPGPRPAEAAGDTAASPLQTRP